MKNTAAQATYMEISLESVDRSIPLSDSVICDINEKGDLVGIEFINITQKQIDILQENISHVSLLNS